MTSKRDYCSSPQSLAIDLVKLTLSKILRHGSDWVSHPQPKTQRADLNVELCPLPFVNLNFIMQEAVDIF
jgi:hypothetical protein